MLEAGRWLWNVRTPMRDGVELSTDLHLPPGGLPGGPYPAVLVRTAANNQTAALVKRARVLADQGIAVALQDVRGREDSAGRFSPFRDEGLDGYDSVEWLAGQDWCNGKVAMMGSGYAGWTQWAAARERPPHLTTLVSTSAWAPGQQTGSGAIPLPMLAWLHAMSARVWQEAGQVDWETALRAMPLRAADEAIGCRLPEWHAWLDAKTPAAHWAPLALTAQDFGTIAVPVLHVAGWYDDTAALRYWEGMREQPHQALVVGPWDSTGTWTSTQQLGGIDFGAPAADDLDALHLQWFQHWLLDAADRPRSRHFVTGTNSWYDGDWAAAADDSTWFLRSDGALAETPPVDEPPDGYLDDPADPVVVSTDLTFFPSAPKQPPQLPLDRRFVERRPDVLSYTTAELPGITLGGRPSVRLFVSSDGTDTDFFVQLCDVAPGGASQLLATGGLRARYRDGLDQETPLVPGEVHELSIELGGVAHVVPAGHRLRVSVMGSCFPLFDRNLHTGGRIGHEAEPLVVTNRVHHDADHPSQLVLPVRSEQQ